MRHFFHLVPRPAMLANLAFRALLVYFGAEAIRATITDPNDRRFAGKGIAFRNALLVGGFSLLLPILYQLGPKRRSFPWAADALMISVPVADMGGNSLDLYNQQPWFDLTTHFYGTAAVGALWALAANGRGLEPAPSRWVFAMGNTTLGHVLLEIQEYWTDVLFGTHNVEGLEDTEGDLLAGMCGALAGTALAELLTSRLAGGWATREAARLGAVFDPLLKHGQSGAEAGTTGIDVRNEMEQQPEQVSNAIGEVP